MNKKEDRVSLPRIRNNYTSTQDPERQDSDFSAKPSSRLAHMISELQFAIDRDEPLSRDTRGILKKILVNDRSKGTTPYDVSHFRSERELRKIPTKDFERRISTNREMLNDM